MHRKTLFGFCLFVCVIFLHSQVIAAKLPILRDVNVNSSVEFRKDTKLFCYSYKIFNLASNTGKIDNIQIDISKPAEGTDLNAAGLAIDEGLDYEGKMITTSFEDTVKNMGTLLRKEIIPVGAKPPKGWSAGISVRGTLSWGVDSDNYLISPGKMTDGYQIFSRGLPSIREIIIKPDWILTVEGYVSEEDLEKSKKIEEEITLHSKTVGPTAPPADLISLSFIDYIIDLEHQASSLGWIKNDGIEKSLDAKLDNAKKKLEQGSPRAAGNILSAFINEVEAQGCVTYDNCPPGKHLTSEAYALLKYNAQYLIDNLK